MNLGNVLGRISQTGLYVSMAGILAVMILVTLDVILRNAMGRTVPGTLEISELLQGLVVFLALAATLRSGNHIAADLLVERLAPRRQAAIDLCTGLVSLATFALMTYALFALATGPGASREITDMLGIPTQPFKLVAAFGVGLMCLEILAQIVSNARKLGADSH